MSAINLVTAADLTNLSRRTFTAAEEATLAGLIASVEGWVQANCLDWSYSASATQTYDGTGCDSLYLGRYLTTLSSLSDDGSALTAANFVNRGHLLIYKDNYFRKDYANIAITGEWGWQHIDDAPADFVLMVRMICLEALPAYFDREESSVSIGGVSQAFLVGVINRNSMIQSTWLKYKGITCA